MLEFKSKDTLHDSIKSSELKKSQEIRIEPPIPVEPVIKSNVEIKQNKATKVDNEITISKDAIKKEEEELEKRPEIDILEKLKIHENEEKKILAESKKILEELKGAHQMQFEKNKLKPVSKDFNVNVNKQEEKNKIVFSDEKKNEIEGMVNDNLPLPLALKEAKNPNKTKMEVIREKRDLTSTIDNNNNDKEENCEKTEKNKNNEHSMIKNDVEEDKYVEHLNVEN